LQKRLLAKRDRYEQGFRHLVARGIRSGEFFPTDPALAARAILGALNSTVLWFNSQGRLTPDELAENFATYLIRGLRAKSSGHARQNRGGRSLDRSTASLGKKLAKTGDPQW
jgi:cytosine/adenosine deaminase-related metal-dependent hydrolase